jgi:hypothetical protein
MMPKFAVLVLVPLLVVVSSTDAGAQCSELKPSLMTSSSLLCTSGTPVIAVQDTRTYEMHTETACLQGGWIRLSNQEKACRVEQILEFPHVQKTPDWRIPIRGLDSVGESCTDMELP